MLTSAETAALVAWLAQSASEELYRWAESQKELGAEGLPPDDSTWGAATIRKETLKPVPVQPVNNSPIQTSSNSSGTALNSLMSFQAIHGERTPLSFHNTAERTMALEVQRAHATACQLCMLFNKRSDILWGMGPADASIMFVAAGGNPRELDKQRILTDDAADLLDKIVGAMSQINPEATLDRIYMTNVIKCACVPPKDKVMEIARCCLRFLRKEVQIIHPKVIIVWGELAHRAMFGSELSITQIRGQWNLFENVPAITTHHPLEMLKNPRLKGRVWTDVQAALEKIH